ncbi:MAG: hypothetical protein GX185_03730 [Tissierellia bacterium]|nr:hypothetical protein [Tissierellia bacterium]
MKLKYPIKYPFLFTIGGIIYYLIEILWRGYSYFSMFILGGLCFLLIGLVNEYYFFKSPLLFQQLVACITITLMEFSFGLIFNVVLGLDLWDYSKNSYNLMGQICLKYSIFWFFLSLPAILLYDYLNYLLFGGKKPQYQLI